MLLRHLVTATFQIPIRTQLLAKHKNNRSRMAALAAAAAFCLASFRSHSDQRWQDSMFGIVCLSGYSLSNL